MENIFTEMNLIKFIFNMIQLMEILKIQQEEQLLAKVLKDKGFKIAKDPKYGKYQRSLAAIVYNFFYKKYAGSGVSTHANNEKLAEELHKPITKEFRKRTVYFGFKDNTWGADLADMQLTSNFNRKFIFLLWATDIFSKYAWVVPFKDKKVITITNAFQKFLKESNRKPNKIWADKGNEFHNRSMKS